MLNIRTNRFSIIVLCLLSLGCGCMLSCKKFVTIPPPINQLVGTKVFNDSATAAGVITSIYERMSEGSYVIYGYPVITFTGATTGSNSIAVYGGLSSDELIAYPNISSFTQLRAYKNALNNSDLLIWGDAYQFINTANDAIEGITGAGNKIPARVRKQLIGEACFIRAFWYFYLTNFFGDVPLAVTTDYKATASLPRAHQAAVYQQIIADLTAAKDSLNPVYVGTGGVPDLSPDERVRPNKWTAAALLARVYLFMNNYPQAEAEATSVIQQSATYSLEPDPNNVFLNTSKEAIWQLEPVKPFSATEDGKTFFALFGPNSYNNPVTMSQSLYNAFEPNDLRFTDWVDSTIQNGITYYFPAKYKVWSFSYPTTEYLMMFRLGEQYLIRAEARAQQGNITGANSAQSDLNAIRERAQLPDNTTDITQGAMLAAIEKERRVELFTEWGHRWLDLKREKGFANPSISRADEIMPAACTAKGGTWNTTDQLYPLPLLDLQLDPALTQNPGYN